METYKLIIELNGKMRCYVYNARTEDERIEKLRDWKAENITPYDKYKVFFNGTLEEQEKLVFKHVQKPIKKTTFQRVECWAKGFFKKKETNILQFDKL